MKASTAGSRTMAGSVNQKWWNGSHHQGSFSTLFHTMKSGRFEPKNSASACAELPLAVDSRFMNIAIM